MIDHAVYLLLALCWLATLAFLLFAEHRQWARYKELTEFHRTERSELLDRLMARNYGEYKSADALQEITKRELDLTRLPDMADMEEIGQ